MRVHLDCFPCFLRQSIIALRLGTKDESLRETILKTTIEKSPDPLWISTRLAIAGNVIDFGIFTSVDIEGAIRKALNNQLAVDDYSSFKNAISIADKILYLTDNAGEIVFDRLLIETLIQLGKEVKAVVKGSPVINDSTMDDAEESGLTEVCDVIDRS